MRSPLKLVVCQVRFPESLAVAEARVGLAIQEALGGRPQWRLEPGHRAAIAFSASLGGAAATQTTEVPRAGWRLVSLDGTRTVSLMPNSVALETTAYEGWEGFLERLGALLQVTTDVIGPEAEERLGLRYINRIEDPRVDSPAGWRQWIRPEALGLVNHSILGAGVSAAQQQIVLDPEEGVKATIRQGFARDDDLGSVPYVLDIDVYRDEMRGFDPAEVRRGAAQMNLVALGLFQNVITDDLYRYFRGDGDDGDR